MMTSKVSITIPLSVAFRLDLISSSLSFSLCCHRHTVVTADTVTAAAAAAAAAAKAAVCSHS